MILGGHKRFCHRTFQEKGQVLTRMHSVSVTCGHHHTGPKVITNRISLNHFVIEVSILLILLQGETPR